MNSRSLSFHLGRISQDLLDQVIAECRLQSADYDRYEDKARRRRRYASVSTHESGVSMVALTSNVFVQPHSSDHSRREMERSFDDLFSGPLVPEPFHQLVYTIQRLFDDIGPMEVGIHAIRTESDLESRGFPAPEGLHRDGYEYIAIVCTDLAPAIPDDEAVTTLVRVADGSAIPIGKLAAGQLLVFSDEEFLHFTSAFGPGTDLYREVVVMTFAAVR